MDSKKDNVVSVLIMTWPNLISLARLFSVPVLIWLILTNRMEWAFWGTVLAGLSDMVDGFVARILKTPSRVGAYLDPLADKVLLVGLYVTLGLKDYVYDWLVILIVFRDLLIIAGTVFLLLLKKKFQVRPLFISKLNTLLQIVLVLWVVWDAAFPIFSQFIPFLMFTVAITTVLSGISYVIIWLRYISEEKTI